MEYTGIYDKYSNKNNKFLEIQEMQMKISDSSFIFCFFTGDPDYYIIAQRINSHFCTVK